MSEGRRRKIEREIADWRAAKRRQDAAVPGSLEEHNAEDDAERHHVEYERLTEEARQDQAREEESGRPRGEPASD